MASTSGSAHETKMKHLDEPIKAINEVLMAAINGEDRVSLNFMLRELKYEKSKLQNKQFGEIMAKYGYSSCPSSGEKRKKKERELQEELCKKYSKCCII